MAAQKWQRPSLTVEHRRPLDNQGVLAELFSGDELRVRPEEIPNQTGFVRRIIQRVRNRYRGGLGPEFK